MTVAWSTLAWVIAVAWIYRYVDAALGYARLPDLCAYEHDRPLSSSIEVTVIVPARNEERGIKDCLDSLLKQDCSRLRVIAVDDRSADATGTIMDDMAVRGGRLEVLRVSDLPPGWLGKTHALALAAREAVARYHPQYFLFTDADVVFDPSIVRRAVAHAIETRSDHFVVMPTTVALNWREGTILTYLQAISLWAVRPWRVTNPRTRDAIGIGAFNLVRAEAYLQIGGFEAAPMEVLEDLYLGRRIKWAGLRQTVAIAPGMVCVHWAAGARGIINGMTKNLFAVFRFRPTLLLMAAAGLMIWNCSVLFTLFPKTRVPGMMIVSGIFGVYAVGSRINRLPAGYALTFPLAGMAFLYAMLRSMWVTVKDGGVTWRGTFYRMGELRRGMVHRGR